MDRIGLRRNRVRSARRSDAKLLKEVKVTGEKDALTMSTEKRVFNVAKNLTSIGGTAESLLRNVPSITLDENGNPSLRNMATTIYINGKPTQLTLAQIPANQIESVEVISNPSARYDASTSGGIVNLVLKKNRQPGYNGIATVSAGQLREIDAVTEAEEQNEHMAEKLAAALAKSSRFGYYYVGEGLPFHWRVWFGC